MAQIEIFLPFPPSNNRLYGARSGHGKGRYKLPGYVDWLNRANTAFASQVRTRLTRPLFNDPVNMIYVFKRPDKRRRDLGNGLKALDDFLTHANVLADDSLIHGVTAFWDTNVSYKDFACFRPEFAGVAITIKAVAV